MPNCTVVVKITFDCINLIKVTGSIGRRFGEELVHTQKAQSKWISRLFRCSSQSQNRKVKKWGRFGEEGGPDAQSCPIIPASTDQEHRGATVDFRDHEVRLAVFKNAVHELRLPLSNIGDLTDTILATKKDVLDTQTLADVTEIQNSVEGTLSVVDTIATLLRVEIVQPVRIAMDISIPIHEAVRRAQSTVNLAGQTINVEVADNVARLEIASESIAEATFLLLIQSSQTAPPHSQIWLSVSQNEEFVTVTVHSEKGVTLLEQASLGVGGLQLLTVDRIIALHHGEFWLSTDLDSNAEYGYRLPVATASEPAKMTVL